MFIFTWWLPTLILQCSKCLEVFFFLTKIQFYKTVNKPGRKEPNTSMRQPQRHLTLMALQCQSWTLIFDSLVFVNVKQCQTIFSPAAQQEQRENVGHVPLIFAWGHQSPSTASSLRCLEKVKKICFSKKPIFRENWKTKKSFVSVYKQNDIAQGSQFLWTHRWPSEKLIHGRTLIWSFFFWKKMKKKKNK